MLHSRSVDLAAVVGVGIVDIADIAAAVVDIVEAEAGIAAVKAVVGSSSAVTIHNYLIEENRRMSFQHCILVT